MKKRLISLFFTTVISSPVFANSMHYQKPVEGKVIAKFNDNRFFRKHYGIDVLAKENDPVKSVSNGRVIRSGYGIVFGNFIVIKSGLYEYLYGHFDSLSVKTGDRVKKGQIIGIVGKTGITDKTHLHFEMKKKGKFIDPLKFYNY